MSVDSILNLLNKFSKIILCSWEHVIVLFNEFNKLGIESTQIIYSIYHMSKIRTVYS
jgi:hypothetical protein